MTRTIHLALLSLTLITVSSCATRTPPPADHSQHQSMPGMSAEDHAKMKKDAMPGMKM